MKSVARLGLAALIVSVLAPLASAATYDAALAGPGFYNGTGGVNSNFAVETSGGIEIGLRASLRANANDAPNTLGTYFVPTGPQTNVTSGGNGANAGRAAWNWDWSVNLQPGNVNGPSNGFELNDIRAVITVSDFSGNTASRDLFLYADSAGWGVGGEHNPRQLTDWGMQNSGNPIFGDFPLAPFYNINQNQTYTFKLDVFSGLTGPVLATNQITVVVGNGIPPVPVPAAAWAGLSMLSGLGFYGWRKRKASV